MKLRSLLLLFLLPLCLQAIAELQVVVGSGIVASDQAKDYHFRYHNLSDDFHLSGPSKWAIRFNFREYAVNDSASFNLNAIRIYNPLAGSNSDLNLRLSLREDASRTSYTGMIFHYPGAEIGSSVTQNGVANGQDIAIPGVRDSLKVAWLVVDLLEPVAGRYLSASEGSGTHSFYYDGPPNQVESNNWVSLNEAGFDCELRIGAIGSFNLNTPRLELSDFTLNGLLNPGARVYPSCSVFNHHSELLSDSLQIKLIGPSGSEYQQIAKMPLRDLIPQDYSNHSFEEGIILPANPMRLKLLLSFTQNSAYSMDSTYVNVFGDTLRLVAVEDFRSSSSALGEIPIDTEQVHHLCYIPALNDSLSNLEAVQRYNYYQFSTLPKTVVMGNKIFQMPVTNDSLQFAISAALQRKSFISSGTCEISAADTLNTMNRKFSFSLQNANTAFDPWTSAFSPMFFAGIFAENTYNGRTTWVITHWLAFSSPVAFLDMGGRFSAELFYNVTDLSRDYNYRVYYWFQDTVANGSELYYAAWAPLIIPDLPVPDHAEDLFEPVLSAYPNPLYGNSGLKTSDFYTPTRVSIYNLKGQLVYSQTLDKGSQAIPAEVFPTSGIYFLRSEPLAGSKQPKQTIKLTIIK